MWFCPLRSFSEVKLLFWADLGGCGYNYILMFVGSMSLFCRTEYVLLFSASFKDPRATHSSFYLFKTIYFLAVPHGMWDLSSPIRDRTCAPCSGSAEP